MNIFAIVTNPLVAALGKNLIDVVASLVKSKLVPKIKRVAFERMTEGLQEFGEFILEQKEIIEKTETKLDDEAYKLSLEAFDKFLNEAQILRKKL
jgi:hypothetical protein